MGRRDVLPIIALLSKSGIANPDRAIVEQMFDKLDSDNRSKLANDPQSMESFLLAMYQSLSEANLGTSALALNPQVDDSFEFDQNGSIIFDVPDEQGEPNTFAGVSEPGFTNQMDTQPAHQNHFPNDLGETSGIGGFGVQEGGQPSVASAADATQPIIVNNYITPQTEAPKEQTGLLNSIVSALGGGSNFSQQSNPSGGLLGMGGGPGGLILGGAPGVSEQPLVIPKIRFGWIFVLVLVLDIIVSGVFGISKCSVGGIDLPFFDCSLFTLNPTTPHWTWMVWLIVLAVAIAWLQAAIPAFNRAPSQNAMLGLVFYFFAMFTLTGGVLGIYALYLMRMPRDASVTRSWPYTLAFVFALVFGGFVFVLITFVFVDFGVVLLAALEFADIRSTIQSIGLLLFEFDMFKSLVVVQLVLIGLINTVVPYDNTIFASLCQVSGLALAVTGKIPFLTSAGQDLTFWVGNTLIALGIILALIEQVKSRGNWPEIMLFGMAFFALMTYYGSLFFRQLANPDPALVATVPELENQAVIAISYFLGLPSFIRPPVLILLFTLFYCYVVGRWAGFQRGTLYYPNIEGVKDGSILNVYGLSVPIDGYSTLVGICALIILNFPIILGL